MSDDSPADYINQNIDIHPAGELPHNIETLLPLELLADLPTVTLPVEWPSIPLDELGHYGTVEPQKGQ